MKKVKEACMDKDQRKYAGYWQLGLLIWSIVMLLILFLPGSEVPNPKIFLVPQIDKVVHFIVFLILSILAFKGIESACYLKQGCRDKREGVLTFMTLGLLLLFAGLSEVVQEVSIPGRGGDLWDFVADSCGIIAGIIVWRYCLRIAS